MNAFAEQDGIPQVLYRGASSGRTMALLAASYDCDMDAKDHPSGRQHFPCKQKSTVCLFDITTSSLIVMKGQEYD